ncbi:MAG: GAF domain-containing protein [Betaproteobacteria bacterium]|nr:GAF domain-containing protein [Betaproteobacteria bacterium]
MERRSRDQELAEALEQQQVTSEILRVIANSSVDSGQVFEMIVRNAVALCGSLFANVFRYDGELLHYVTSHNTGPGYVELLQSKYPMRPDISQVSGRVILSRSIVRLEDARADPDYDQRFPTAMGWRRMLGVPMLREGRPLGVIVVGWAESGPVPKAQEELLSTFADQAVIAVENVRLFHELQSRNRQITVTLEQQTATAEILRVISSSPSDVLPVFQTIARNAVALCGSLFANVFRYDGELLHYVTSHNAGPAYAELVLSKYPMRPDLSQVSGRVVLSKSVVRLEDARADPDYDQKFTVTTGWRRLLGVPMLREGKPIGAIAVGWAEAGPVPKTTEELLKTFAEQAVIAVENVRLFDEIQDKGRQLELANTYKSRFLAAASHDLRQPLHALNMFVGQLHAEPVPAERSRLVARIDAAVGAMNELFNSLLDMSKLEAGVLEVNLTEFPVERVLRQIETTFAGAAREKGLRLDVVSSGAWVRSDFILLERILLNLVSNAVRYTARGGVAIGCRRRGERLRLDVWDSGPGIPEDQHRNIFQEFYQLAGPGTARRGGLGLGLAIVDRLGSLLSHPIEISSTLGRGSRFSVSVPVVAQPSGLQGAPVSPAAVTDPVAGKLIVVIDDDALVLDGMGGILRSWGCSVVTAATGTAALARLKETGQRPDAIVSDYRLAGGKTGIEAIECLRSAMGAAIPAFLISGDTSPERLREAKGSGHHLLHKPVPPMALRAMLNRLLKATEGAGESTQAGRA